MAEDSTKPDAFDRALAEQIEAEREARDWTRVYTFERAGLSRSTYDRIISVERSPRMDQLQALASAFGLKRSELLRRAEVREQRILGEGDQL